MPLNGVQAVSATPENSKLCNRLKLFRANMLQIFAQGIHYQTLMLPCLWLLFRHDYFDSLIVLAANNPINRITGNTSKAS